jgi:Cu-processing system permease protein
MMRLRSIVAIARTTVIEQIRNRLYLVILFFGGAILVSSILLGALAPGHRVRVIFDLGLVTLEIFGLATAVFGAVSLVLQETESKTIYLILTRPVSRSVYILGRYLGLVAAVLFTMAAMSVLHLGAMLYNQEFFREFTYGWSFWSTYPILLLMAAGKMMITASLALFFSLFASSQVSSLVFTGFFWIAGHFWSELKFLIDRSVEGGALKMMAMAAATVLPNFQYFNLRDTYSVPHFAGFDLVWVAFVYGLAYTGAFLALSVAWFSRKEF